LLPFRPHHFFLVIGTDSDGNVIHYTTPAPPEGKMTFWSYLKLLRYFFAINSEVW